MGGISEFPFKGSIGVEGLGGSPVFFWGGCWGEGVRSWACFKFISPLKP